MVKGTEGGEVVSIGGSGGAVVKGTDGGEVVSIGGSGGAVVSTGGSRGAVVKGTDGTDVVSTGGSGGPGACGGAVVAGTEGGANVGGGRLKTVRVCVVVRETGASLLIDLVVVVAFTHFVLLLVTRSFLVEMIVRVVVFTTFRLQHGDAELPPLVLPLTRLALMGQTGHK